MPDSDAIDDADRRDFLGKATMAVGAAGVAAACWPFINSMNPSVDTLEKATAEVDLSGIAPGQSQTVSWGGKPVFVFHRTPAQIAAMKISGGGKDLQADVDRVRQPQWLVVIGVCTHMGCIPLRAERGWLCPCHGSVYDDSGRILHGPAPRNLAVPPYRFVSDDKIIVGKA
ncbi:MAG TPA: ubiquinol-cytochrome c reductase iron-sulfur subunit [Burkholderiales bacterium]|nr:ubiquinol-cytochrome c reductase iron-sulfur subunit [Burkholderiales bacterium]